MSEQKQGVSLSPDDFGVGGLIDDFDGVIKAAIFDTYDFEGKADESRPCLFIQGLSKDGEPFSQHFSAGDLKRLVPSDDGQELIPVGESAASVIKSSNTATFLTSLVNNGFPKEKLAERRIGVIVGLCAHFRRVAQPKRSGLKQETEGGREPQVLVVEKILSLPWEKAAFTPAEASSKVTGPGVSRSTGSGGAPTQAAVIAAAPVSSGELDSKTEALVVELLATSGGTISKAVLPGKIFQLCGKDPESGKILSLSNKADWLGNAARPWKYDPASAVLTLG